MAPQATQTPYASEIGSSIYQRASSTSTVPSSATTAPAASDEDDRGANAWGNYLYIVVILCVILLIAGFLYRRKRRSSRTATLPPRSRFQVFHTHHPSQSRDLSAVQANNRVWRNMRAGPFSHHARMDSAAMRRSGVSNTAGRCGVDLTEEVPPPYVLAEPERTLDRGPSIRDMRDARPDGGTRDDVNLNDLLGTREGGSITKPPGYEESDVARRES